MCKLQWNKKNNEKYEGPCNFVSSCYIAAMFLFLFFYFVVSVNEQLRIVLLQNISETESLRVGFRIWNNLGSISAEFYY